MIRYLFVLLLAGAAVCSRFLALFGINARNRPRTEDIGYWVRRSFEPISSPRDPTRVTPVPRIVTLLAAAAILGTGAYLGLDQTASQASVPAVAPATSEPRFDASEPGTSSSLHDELRAMMARPKISSPAASAEPTPAPALAPTPEAPQPTPEPVAVLAAAATPVPPDGLEGIVCSKPWPCDQAIAVASCESGLDRNGRLDGNWARNGNNFGLFQINGIHADLWPDFDTSWMDPVKNTEWAFEIWSANGWRPWSCQP
jgi:Lysozyme like domain